MISGVDWVSQTFKERITLFRCKGSPKEKISSIIARALVYDMSASQIEAPLLRWIHFEMYGEVVLQQ